MPFLSRCEMDKAWLPKSSFPFRSAGGTPLGQITNPGGSAAISGTIASKRKNNTLGFISMLLISWLFQVQRLRESSVARRVPYGEAYPLLAGGLEWNAELPGAERSQIGGRNHLRVGGFPVAPHQFHELQRKRPLYFRVINAAWSGALDAPIPQQDF